MPPPGTEMVDAAVGESERGEGEEMVVALSVLWRTLVVWDGRSLPAAREVAAKNLRATGPWER